MKTIILTIIISLFLISCGPEKEPPKPPPTTIESPRDKDNITEWNGSLTGKWICYLEPPVKTRVKQLVAEHPEVQNLLGDYTIVPNEQIIRMILHDDENGNITGSINHTVTLDESMFEKVFLPSSTLTGVFNDKNMFITSKFALGELKAYAKASGAVISPAGYVHASTGSSITRPLFIETTHNFKYNEDDNTLIEIVNIKGIKAERIYYQKSE